MALHARLQSMGGIALDSRISLRCIICTGSAYAYKARASHIRSGTGFHHLLFNRSGWKLPSHIAKRNYATPVEDGDSSRVLEIPYGDLIVGIPREIYPEERRVAISPQNVALLLKKGFYKVTIEQGAGEGAKFSDLMYEAAGARIVDRDTLWSQSDVVLKVRAPSTDGPNSEIDMLKRGTVLISMIQPLQNKSLVDAIARTGATSFAMDMIPRISRAQVFDVLSSMANSAGYKAVLEAANHFGRFLVGQTTAAGKIPPGKVLVIGAGVAGLSAITTAKRMGAIVRGFDTRPIAREQVESLGAEFLQVSITEDGSGAGGYGKEMSRQFIEAEMKLFMQQAKDVDIIITTALIPGRPAPKLILKEHVAAMKPGSIIVDLAAETGGNCESTVPGKLIVENGVTIIGYTDLPSRLPTQSSTLYSNNIVKFLLSISASSGKFGIDLNDEVVRGSIVTKDGTIIPTAPRPAPPANPVTTTRAIQMEEPVVAMTPWQKAVRDVITVSGAMGGMLALGKFTSPLFMTNIFTTGLAGLIGYRAVWGVAPALHSPLMSVTNAISGMVGVGGFFIMGGGYLPETIPQAFGAASVLLAFVNIGGGFVITKRMLDMFKRASDPPEYAWLYVVPGAIFGGGFLVASSTGMAGLVQAGYLVSSVLCISSISGLSAQSTARQGNLLGILGVTSGVLASLGAVGFSPAVFTQWGVLAGIGTLFGALLGQRITPTDLPQTVAALHSVVGLAAVLTSIGSVMAHINDISMLHMVTGYLGVLIGGITFTGSIVAFLKLAGKMSSRPIRLPGKHLVNSTLLTANIATMGAFLTLAPGAPIVAAACLAGSTALSFAKGFTTTASIGGADMPVVITVLNAYSGFALLAEGLMLDNPLLMTVGSLIGVSGSILSYMMCVAMNRSLPNVLFGGISSTNLPTTSDSSAKQHGPITSTTIDEVSESLINATSVIIVPGFGMAQSKAQYALSSVAAELISQGIRCRFAIHPVAGRMPGQCNVLLAEANVPYDIVCEMDEINADFPDTDVVLVVGANDTVNPAALEKGSAIAGMPVLEVWKAKQVVVLKRGMAGGYADVENPLFWGTNTVMLFGDGKKSTEGVSRPLSPSPYHHHLLISRLQASNRFYSRRRRAGIWSEWVSFKIQGIVLLSSSLFLVLAESCPAPIFSTNQNVHIGQSCSVPHPLHSNAATVLPKLNGPIPQQSAVQGFIGALLRGKERKDRRGSYSACGGGRIWTFALGLRLNRIYACDSICGSDLVVPGGSIPTSILWSQHKAHSCEQSIHTRDVSSLSPSHTLFLLLYPLLNRGS